MGIIKKNLVKSKVSSFSSCPGHIDKTRQKWQTHSPPTNSKNGKTTGSYSIWKVRATLNGVKSALPSGLLAGLQPTDSGKYSSPQAKMNSVTKNCQPNKSSRTRKSPLMNSL